MSEDQNARPDTTDPYQCDWCRGAGKVPQMDDGPIDCPVCKGTGRKNALSQTTIIQVPVDGRRKKVRLDPLQAALNDQTHDWFTPKFIGYECCRQCGIVRRRDRMNSRCKGSVGISLRKEVASA